MNDTPAHIEDRYREMIMSRSASERLTMASRMFAAAKALAVAGIRDENADAGPEEVNRLLFSRFYGGDFSENQQRVILDSLAATRPPFPNKE